MAATSTAKQKTHLLYRIAAELNIGRETIVEYLQSKGFELPNKPNSKLTEEMHDLVMNKFEKEHRQIEKQRRKVDAYHERRTRPRKSTDQDKEMETEEAREVPQDASSIAETKGKEQAPPVSEETERTDVVQEYESEESLPVEAEAQPEVAEVETEAPVEEVVPEPVIEEPIAPELEEVIVEVEEVQPEEPVIVEEVVEPEVVEVESEKIELEDDDDEEEADDDDEEDEIIVKTSILDDEPVIKKPKLKGLSVVGKIDISKQEEATKAARKKRKKRKRIRESKSVDINAEVGTAKRGGGATTGGATAAGKAPAGKTPASKPATTTTARTTTATTGDKRKRKRKGVSVDQGEVQRAIRETFSRMDDRSGSARQKRSRQKRGERQEQRDQEMQEMMDQQSVISVAEYATVAELANLMNVDVSDVISKCIGLGLMVSINQRLDKDTIQLVADEFDFTIEFQEEYAEDILLDEEDPVETLKPRAPIVTIMGHVDHGKTSLLDYVRNANVVAGEAGGITQHIGAYSVELEDGRHITFLDTPGHEAFTAMRARGAQVTDIVVLIVAADDSVMPQTLEAISHAQAASVPMVVAINKVDKPEANPDRIKQQLADRGVLVESWGGKYQAVEISAKKGINIDKLLEAILLEAELLDLKANPDRLARGTIIEAEVDRGRGPVATVLVQKGTLKIGDPVIAGQYSGRIRAMMDERGHRIKVSGPSMPVQILGLDGVPTSGDTFVSVETEQEAREIATKRQQLRREQEFKQGRRRFSLDDISQQIAQGAVQDLPLIIKGDVDGSVEALGDALLRLSTPEVQVSIVMKAVGEITESDVLLAAASSAIIIGFHVRPNLKARKLAEAEGVDIRTYRVIYDTVNEIRAALEGMLAPEKKEEITSTVEVREVFKISRVGTIAGCYVQDGKITRNDRVRLLRDGLEVFDGTISSLKRHKDDVREVEQGYECGITLENMNDVKVGDIIEAYRTVEIKRRLEDQPTSADAG